MKINTIKGLAFTIIASCISIASFAQAPTLPDIAGATKDGINILSYNNPYNTGVKSILVQRSNDSVQNFTEIGSVPKLGAGVANFIDPLPQPGYNYYRLSIQFTSGIEFKTNLIGISVDSAAIANRKQLPAGESLQKLVNNSENIDSTAVLNKVKQVETVAYPKSKYVFTNPFSGHINIELIDALTQKYDIIFYSLDNKEVLKIKRLSDPNIILDKRNFKKTGVYKFVLNKNTSEFDKGFITIY